MFNYVGEDLRNKAFYPVMTLPTEHIIMKQFLLIVTLVTCFPGVLGQSSVDPFLFKSMRPSEAMDNFELTSPSFKEGETLADSTVLNALDCHGPNRSPALEWRNAPSGTKSFVLILDDFEARGGDGFIHWAVYNIPAKVTGLRENAGASERDLSTGGRHAYNDFLKRSYGGPCPPEGPPHKYRFTVYALDLPSIDDAGTPMTWRKLRFIIRDHILANASLTGLRGH